MPPPALPGDLRTDVSGHQALLYTAQTLGGDEPYVHLNVVADAASVPGIMASLGFPDLGQYHTFPALAVPSAVPQRCRQGVRGEMVWLSAMPGTRAPHRTPAPPLLFVPRPAAGLGQRGATQAAALRRWPRTIRAPPV